MENITHYFVYVGHSTQTKNKLQDEFNSYLKSLQGTLVDANKLQLLKKRIIEKASELNQKYKRCTPLQISFSELHGRNGFMICGFYFLTFQILQACYDSN